VDLCTQVHESAQGSTRPPTSKTCGAVCALVCLGAAPCCAAFCAVERQNKRRRRSQRGCSDPSSSRGTVCGGGREAAPGYAAAFAPAWSASPRSRSAAEARSVPSARGRGRRRAKPSSMCYKLPNQFLVFLGAHRVG
jgi:hypothetical protein